MLRLERMINDGSAFMSERLAFHGAQPDEVEILADLALAIEVVRNAYKRLAEYDVHNHPIKLRQASSPLVEHLLERISMRSLRETIRD